MCIASPLTTGQFFIFIRICHKGEEETTGSETMHNCLLNGFEWADKRSRLYLL